MNMSSVCEMVSHNYSIFLNSDEERVAVFEGDIELSACSKVKQQARKSERTRANDSK